MKNASGQPVLHVFVAGMGYAGSRIAQALAASGHRVSGLSRSGRGSHPQVPVLARDVTRPLTLDLPPVDLLVFACSGSQSSSPADYRSVYVDGPARVADALRWTASPRIFFLSSTGVYGETDGSWVDEDTPPNPMHPAGEVMLEAEQALRAFSPLALCLRLSGIYGPGRTRMIQQARRRGPLLKPEVWANQIHVDDIAATVTHLVRLPGPLPDCLLVTDDAPARRREIFTWMRRELGCPEGELDQPHPETASRERGNKRCRNQRLRSLGVPLRYPDYHRGYAPLLKQAQASSGVRECVGERGANLHLSPRKRVDEDD